MATWLAAGAPCWILIGALAVLPASPADAPDDRIGVQDDDGRTAARPAHALDHHLLRTVSLDLLGRSPYRAEYGQWLDRGLREYLDEVLGSEEFWAHWLEEQLYYFFLIDNFRPENERVLAVPEALADGRLQVRDALHRIVLSPSFEMRNPGADTFVTVVMEQLLGVEVQRIERELEIGKKIYDGGRGLFLGDMGETQADVVRIAVGDKRFALHFLRREHARVLRREPGKKALAGWARRLRSDSYAYTVIVREWLLSDVYQARLNESELLPNRLFVRALFVDLLDRLPTREEVETLRNALDGLSDSAPLRSIVARLLLDSGTVPVPDRAGIADASAWVTDLFQRLYGRDPTSAELLAFTEAMAEPACRPETVLYALVSHPEYHRF